ncbi:hypothetical protein MAMC_01141 [Methylacidimicrobium cyclopophantes]|uniref:Methyltransferase FkbM domain-containing protein n=1 Tax=Methylacidimicrobium cyclopophantes TaxID=1041766 RepID=A0A5E6MFC4_9BACT|nr:FkbM family methyltransferase [Methylacidimicrobium cyclopophantes]VVM06543.1 hypothetical protein MAMC_01141 [Methylacidimicrobium cyclopophantes]
MSREPHPELFEELRGNIGRWAPAAGFAEVDAVEAAATSEDGSIEFETPECFGGNRGTGRVRTSGGFCKGNSALLVQAVRLENLLKDRPVGVMKVDVEGHELSVFEGCGSLLAAGRVRDMLFECFLPHPNPVTEHLHACGYSLFQVQVRPTGPFPVLLPMVERGGTNENLLATREPERLMERFRRPGWLCLRGKRVLR